jgi:hypothetical protein
VKRRRIASVPPGAESNPDLLRSVAGPDSSAARLEELPGAPAEFVESLPEKQVVEVPTHEMAWLTKPLAVAEGIEHAIHEMAHGGSKTAGRIAHIQVFRTGGRLFKVVDYGYSIYRIWEAPAEERVGVALEETGRLGVAISAPTSAPGYASRSG